MRRPSVSFLPLGQHISHPGIYIHSIDQVKVFGRHNFTDQPPGDAFSTVQKNRMGTIALGQAQVMYYGPNT